MGKFDAFVGSRVRMLGAAIAAVAICAIVVGVGVHLTTRAGAFYNYDGLAGPTGRDVAPVGEPTAMSAFEGGSGHEVAILVTDTDSQWLGLARAFRAAGIPFVITTDPAQAMRHRVVLVYPIISGRALSAESLRGLAQHVRSGGTLLGFDLQGGGLESVFGVRGSTATRSREMLRWAGANEADATTHFSDAQSDGALASQSFALNGATAIASYEDGAAAVVCHDYGGRACLMGVDLGLIARRAFDGRSEGVGRAYVNVYEPSLDVMVRWVRDLYVAGEPMPWLIATTPPEREVAIVLTHDIDYTRSVDNMAAYAAMERGFGVRATYFLQTKYIRDYNDDVFFTQEAAPQLRALAADGMEIASHSVSHSNAFSGFPFGSGSEAYPRYRPFVESATRASGGTVLGELRVSRFVLESVTGAPVRSFRPGHLSNPFRLPDALVATGYQNSSTAMAGVSLTHLPFQATYGRAGQSLAPIFEFPVTIEDEKPPLLGSRFDAADEIVEQVARHRGLVVVLIHTDITDHKLEMERRLIERWRDRAWFVPLDEYAAWWRARDGVNVSLVRDGRRWTARVRAPDHEAPLEIYFPRAGHVTRAGDGFRMEAGRLMIAGGANGATVSWNGP